MADEETNEEIDRAQPAEPAASQETNPAQPAEPEAPAEDAPADDAAVEETPEQELAEDAGEAVEEAPDEELAEAADEPEAAQEPEEELSPKERRRRERSTHSGEPRPQRGADERVAERAAKRQRNAAVRRRYRARGKEKRAAQGAREGTPPAERASTGSARVRQGVVVSDGADKTITVRIDLARQHRTYGKIVRTTSKLHAHDERNEAAAGDTVRVVESRPLSRTKRWRLIEVVERAR